jgi:diguanylate cyclase (GGDEF)-like protein/PAS domain S-box-containing protein
MGELLPHGRTLPREAWERRHRAILGMLWAHALALALLVGALGRDRPLTAALLAVPVPLFALLGGARRLGARGRAVAVSLGLLTASALLVHVTGGMIEAHFHFFLVVGVVTFYEDWLPLGVASAFVLVHHGVLGTLAPAAVYMHGGNPWVWAVVHGLAIAGAAAIGVVGWRMNESVRRGMRAAEQQSHRAFAEAPIGMVLLDARGPRAGAIVATNRAFERMLGRSGAELTASGWEGVTHPDDQASTQAFVDALAAGTVDEARLEKRYVHADGHEVWTRVSCALIRDEHGQPLHWISQVEDVTDRRRAEADLACLSAVTEALALAVDLEDAMPRVLELLADRLGWWSASFARLGEDGRAVAPTWRLVADGPPTGEAGTLAAVPVRDGRVLAVLEFTAPPPRAATAAAERALLAQVTRLLALFLDRLRRVELLAGVERVAATDPLTGLANRRAWDQELPRELARARREGRPVSVALLDLDRFKAYNDEHGHPAGDALLRRCANAWRAQLRGSDLLARYGGEEFGVVLPDCGLDAAHDVLDALRAVMPDAQTCSVGLVCSDGTDDVQELVARADRALYAAKRVGRDRIVVGVRRALSPAP